ncbi:ANTAR domain-containing protein [Fulvimarina sp. MAC8]|uniref:ANTAR domain-containing response regulator n=1 Tax=Fulvimarina sp. MAC8 TaxID=3162874 RepID=UPI0032EF66A7
MSARARIPNLGGAKAFILHRPHATTLALSRSLSAIGLVPVEAWPELPAGGLAADFVFFDADLGFDEQFPWRAGDAPMPQIALIGSEAPGRIEWALGQSADSHLVKPVGGSGVYSALLIARRSFDARRNLAREVESLKARASERQTIVRAVVALSESGVGEEQAYAQLRTLAMSWRVTIEEAARRIVELKTGGADERSRCL